MIPDTLYAALTPIERIRAAVSAAAREDSSELDRLKRTTAKFSYQVTDPAYYEAMQALTSFALATEHNMRGCAIECLMASCRTPIDPDAMKAAITSLREDLETFRRVADHLGIDPDELEKFGPPRHPYVLAMIPMADVEDAYEFDEENVKRLVAGFLAMLPEALLSA